MPLKSVFDIEVNDTAFRNFAALYDRYAQSLKGMPAAWKAVTDKIDGSRSAFDKMVAGMVAANVQEKLRAEAEKQAALITRTTADRWHDMARSTKTVAGNIASATGQLLKWTGVISAMTGLLGAGGIWGIDRLALNAAATRRSSLGLGLGFGEQRAFGNFGRLIDPDSFLSAVAGAKFDITKRVGLIGAGLTPDELGGDTAQTGVALLRHLKQIADTTNPALFAQTIQARRLGDFVGPEDLERLRNTSPDEFAKLLAKYTQTRSLFDLRPNESRSVQDLSTQISNAWRDIETGFFRKIAQMSPTLTHLSESFEKVARAFLDSPALAHWIDVADRALERFAKFVGSTAFEKDVKSFVEVIEDASRAIWGAVKWIADKFGVSVKEPLSPATAPESTADVAESRSDVLRRQREEGKASAWGQLVDALTSTKPIVAPSATLPPWQARDMFASLGGGGGVNVASLTPIVAGLEKRGFSQLEASAIAGNLDAESSLDPAAVNPTSGAFGLEQLLGQRKTAFTRFAAATHRDPAATDTQLDWIAMERSGESIKYGGTDERAAFRAAFAQPDLKSTTDAFAREVERPSRTELATSLPRRERAASAAYQASPPTTQATYATSGRTVITIDQSVGGNPIYSVNALKN